MLPSPTFFKISSLIFKGDKSKGVISHLDGNPPYWYDLLPPSKKNIHVDWDPT